MVRRNRGPLYQHLAPRAAAATTSLADYNPYNPKQKTVTIRTTGLQATGRPTAAVTSTTAAAINRNTAVTSVTTISPTEATTTPTTTAGKGVHTTTGTSSAPSSSSSSNLNAASSSNKSSTSTSHTGTIVGVIVAIIAVIAIIAAFFGYKKYKANRAARGSGAGLVGGAGAYGRHKEEDDEVFGNSSTGPNAEKNYGSTAGGAYSGNGAGNGPAQNSYGGGQNNAFNNNNQGGGNAYGSAAMRAQDPYGRGAPNAVTFAGVATGAGMAGMGARGQNNDGGRNQNQPMLPSKNQAQQHLDQSWESSGPQSNYPPSSVGSTTHLLREEGTGYAGGMSQGAGAGLGQGQGAMMPTIVEKQVEPPKSPFGDAPGQGKIYVVKNTFVPSQSDELDIYPDDRVQVLVAYDDGWALGINLDAAAGATVKGVFPFDCVQEISPSTSPPHHVDLSATAPASSQFPQPPTHAPLPSPNAQSSSNNEDGFLSYDHPSPTMGPPQLAPLRSDSPLGAHFNSKDENGNLPSSLQPGGGEGNKVKRTSSLIASRDADLFVALGQV
ncbi:hypothetical protein P7C70_g6382, partial [Phenoliferia sp. Uapishka_3]